MLKSVLLRLAAASTFLILVSLPCLADEAAGASKGGPTASVKTPITKLADLPPRSYPIDGKASVLVENREWIMALAGKVSKDIQSDLDTYDIQDATTLRRLYGTLLDIAMLRKDYPAAQGYVAKVRSFQEKPAEKLTSGLVVEALAGALLKSGEDFRPGFRANLDRALAALPYKDVQNNLKSAKASYEIVSKNLILGSMISEVDPVASSGTLSQDYASTILHSAYVLQYPLPLKEEVVASYTAILDANKVARKADIWKEREIVWDAAAKLVPVTIGIWDSGTDIAVFKDRLFVNKAEVPANGKDDDGNGFVDDLNGIAWTLHSDPSTELLFPAKEMGGDTFKYKGDVKGLEDLQANVESPEADALKKKLAGLPQDQVKPFLEGLNAFALFAHGTHVAGIAVKGNPAARILVDRLTFSHHVVPEKPTVEQAQKDAAAMVKSVAYFKKNGVRVVNMSWGGDLKEIDNALEQNRAGGTPEARRALAKQIFDITYKELYEAVKAAPDTLFVIAAGNSDNDVKFEDVFPSSFRLPNVLVAGAVDQAGDQTSFTSFGNVDVYANGFEVESYIPGGETIKFSGTSMAAPNVSNLAAKLWAQNPKLTVAEVRSAIVNGSEEKKAGAATIRLIDPRKSLMLARAKA